MQMVMFREKRFQASVFAVLRLRLGLRWGLVSPVTKTYLIEPADIYVYPPGMWIQLMLILNLHNNLFRA